MPYVTVLNLDGKDTQAMVSPSDFTAVTSHHWILKNGYAVTRRSNRYVSMHRLVMGPPPPGQSIDHVDRNRLNNTRENLRFATAVSQARNRGSSRRKHQDLAGVVGVQRVCRKAIPIVKINGVYQEACSQKVTFFFLLRGLGIIKCCELQVDALFFVLVK